MAYSNFGVLLLAAACGAVLACGPGAYLATGDVCTPCPPGSYQTQVNQTDCVTCPDGTANPNTGSTTQGDCDPCSPGTANTGRAAVCPDCVEGTYEPDSNSPACTRCRAGYYATNVTGGTLFSQACVACPAGTEKPSDVPGFADACTTCEDGSYNPFAGSATCAVCTQGGEVNAERTSCSTASSGGVTSNIEEEEGLLGTQTPLELGTLISLISAGGCLLLIVAYAVLAPNNTPEEDTNDALSKFYLTEEQRRSSSGKGSRGGMASSQARPARSAPKKGPKVGSSGLQSAGGKKKPSRSRSGGKKNKATKGLGVVNAAMR